MFDFVKFGSTDWPASPDVLNGHPYKHIVLITTILKHIFRCYEQTKTKKNQLGIILIYFYIPHYDTDNYVASDFKIWRLFFKNTRPVDLVL